MTTAFDQEALEQLGRLQHAYLPGNLLAAIGFPALVLVPMLSCCLLWPLIAVADKDEPAKPTKEEAQQADGATVLGAICVCFTPVFWIGGSVGLILLRNRLNSDFVYKNTIHLVYSLPSGTEVRYK